MDDREIEAAATLLNRHPDFRVLRKLEVDEGRTGAVPVGGSWTGVVLATRSISLGNDARALLELSMRRIRFDQRGAIVEISDPAGWVEDLTAVDFGKIGGADGPAPIPAGNDTAMRDMRKMVEGADVIVAHHARAHRPFVAHLFPETADIDWHCTLEAVNWSRRGFEGLSLGELLQHVGLFVGARGAAGDVDSLLYLILLSAVNSDSVLAEAIGRRPV